MKFDRTSVDWSLYAILDRGFFRGRPLQALARAVVEGGAGVVQLRDKTSESREFYEAALAVKSVTEAHAVPLIINDRLDVALAVDAEGVHLGQEDLPLTVARRLLGEHRILGASVHDAEECRRAVAEGADYLGVGTIYPTSTKEKERIMGIEVVHTVRRMTDLPMVAIGGITLDNLEPVLRAGADGVAVISALLGTEDVRHRAREFVERIAAVKAAMKQEIS